MIKFVQAQEIGIPNLDNKLQQIIAYPTRMVTVQPHVQSSVEKMIKFVQVPKVMMVAKFQEIVSQQKRAVQIMDQYVKTIGATKNAKKRRRENVARRRSQKIVKKLVENAKTSGMSKST